MSVFRFIKFSLKKAGKQPTEADYPKEKIAPEVKVHINSIKGQLFGKYTQQ